VVPTVLPALDLGQWTGWLYLGESDLFILITIAVLLVLPPAPRTGLPLTRFALFALLLSIFTYGASIAVGLWLVPAVPTDNPYLSAWNALRIAKGFFLALALFPFLRRDILLRTNTLEWFGAGMISGLLLVAAGIIVERAVFASLFDFSGEYRVSAAFTSMHIGGGHIGAYLAMAIPFLSLCVIGERAGLLVGAVLSTIAGYALAVTFARTAYAATILAVVISGVGWAVAARRARQSHAMRPLLGGLAIAAFIGAAALGSPFMHERLANADAGLAGREANWISGLSVHNADLATALVGMGLGTFPRVYRSRAIDAPVPTDFVVRHADGRSWLVIRPGPSSFYFGQKVGVTATGSYTLLVDLRAPNGAATVSFGLCEKLLLYSDNCRSVAFTVTPGEWRHERAILQVDRLTAPALFGLIRRPVELSFSIGGPNATAEITGVRLLDAQQNDLVHNGEFAQGSDRWLFTSDDHRAWRIFDQPLMVWFEQGAFGLAAYLCLCAAALLGLWRAISVGNRTAAPFIAAIAGYLCSGFFDFLLEAPRLSTLFYLFCFTGLAIPKWPKAIAGVQ
jgi:O-antigen ligase